MPLPRSAGDRPLLPGRRRSMTAAGDAAAVVVAHVEGTCKRSSARGEESHGRESTREEVHSRCHTSVPYDGYKRRYQTRRRQTRRFHGRFIHTRRFRTLRISIVGSRTRCMSRGVMLRPSPSAAPRGRGQANAGRWRRARPRSHSLGISAGGACSGVTPRAHAAVSLLTGGRSVSGRWPREDTSAYRSHLVSPSSKKVARALAAPGAVGPPFLNGPPTVVPSILKARRVA